MLNIEKYKEEIIKEFANVDHLEQCLFEVAFRHGGIKLTQDKKRVFIEEMIDWFLQEYKEPILDDVEREYLSAVIKPFRNNIRYICKYENYGCATEHIYICLENKRGELESISLPTFKEGTMYKNMEACKKYSLEELGL